MKKLFGIAALVIMLIVTGCGADTLTCKPKDGKEEFKYTFKDNKITKYEIKTTYDTKEEAAIYAEAANLAYGSQEGIKVTSKGKTLTITYSGKALEGEESKTTKAELKAEMEKEGFTCK